MSNRVFIGAGGVTMQLRLTDALAFGALISAVDPVATLAIFSAMDVEPVLNMLGTDIKSYKNFSRLTKNLNRY